MAVLHHDASVVLAWVLLQSIRLQPCTDLVLRVDRRVLAAAHILLGAIFEFLHALELDLERCEHWAILEAHHGAFLWTHQAYLWLSHERVHLHHVDL